jgi:hypothetical protein
MALLQAYPQHSQSRNHKCRLHLILFTRVALAAVSATATPPFEE